MKYNITLIVIDTLREDYGHEFDSILQKLGFHKIENVIAPAPWTVPSHASMLTGEYPTKHGAHEDKERKIGQAYDKIKLNKVGKLITFYLKKRGYHNYLISANEFVSPEYGFRLFDKYWRTGSIGLREPIKISDEERKYVFNLYKKEGAETHLKRMWVLFKNKKYRLLIIKIINKIGKMIDQMWRHIQKWPLDKGITKTIRIIKKNKFKQPFFLLVNLMEFHEPYPAARPIKYSYAVNITGPTPELIQHNREGASAEVRYLKEKLPLLIKSVINESNVVIITSDHGQLLGEHNKLYHGTFLYDELLRVPFWIRIPKDIEKKLPKRDKMLSLTSIPKLIKQIVEGSIIDLAAIQTEIALSETYGINVDSMVNIKSEKFKPIIEDLEKHRVKVYTPSGQVLLNITDRKVEFGELTENIIKELKEQLNINWPNKK